MTNTDVAQMNNANFDIGPPQMTNNIFSNQVPMQQQMPMQMPVQQQQQMPVQQMQMPMQQQTHGPPTQLFGGFGSGRSNQPYHPEDIPGFFNDDEPFQ